VAARAGAGVQRITEDLEHRAGPGLEAIHRPEEGLTGLGAAPHVLHDLGDLLLIALRGDGAPQEQPRKDTDGGRHPDRPALGLDVELSALHLAQVNLTLADDLLLHRLGVLASLSLPGGDRTFVQPKGGHDRWYRAAKGQQGHNHDDLPERILQPIQRRALRLGKGLAAGMADVTSFLV